MTRTTPLSAAFTTWIDGIVWWEIRFGIIFALFAIYFWRKGLRSLP